MWNFSFVIVRRWPIWTDSLIGRCCFFSASSPPSLQKSCSQRTAIRPTISTTCGPSLILTRPPMSTFDFHRIVKRCIERSILFQMGSSLFGDFEQQYSVQTAEITSRIGGLANLEKHERLAGIQHVQRLLVDVESLLEQMELTVRELDPARSILPH